MRQSRVNRRTVKRQNRQSRQNRQNRQNKQKRNKRQRGGKIVLPMEYFGNKNEHYSLNPTIAEGQFASSHGIPMAGQQMVGPDLRIAAPVKQQGGGVLPAEYYGGNSGRYYEEGAPELANCESAYGTIFPSSHGVVMGGNNSQWMGPNLASFPNATKLRTGGKRSRRTSKRGGGYGSRKNKKTRNNKSKKGSKKRGGGCGSCPGNKKSKPRKNKKSKGKRGCGCKSSCKKC